MLSCAHTGNPRQSSTSRRTSRSDCQYRACREWVFYQLGGRRYNTTSTRDRGLSGIAEDKASKDVEARRDPDRRGTEMAMSSRSSAWMQRQSS